MTNRSAKKMGQCENNISNLLHKKRGRKRMRRISKWNNDYQRIANAVNKNPLIEHLDDVPW